MSNVDAALRDLTNERAVIEQATQGVAVAIDELVRRHGPAAWGLSVALLGDPDRAQHALTEGFATALTAIGTGRTGTDTPFRPLVLASVRNAAIDRIADAMPIDDSLLATTLADVPEQWRTAVWLSAVTHLSMPDIATVLDHTAPETEALLARARTGLRQRYLAAHLHHSGDRNCARAVARLGAAVDETLGADDRDKVDRHLRLCAGCRSRRAMIVALPTDLAALVPPVPTTARDRVRAAVVPVAGAAVGRTGMSERSEKILAGVSAFAATVGVLGAALFGLDNSTDREADLAVAPVAPIVGEVITPTGVDLTGAIQFPSAAIAGRRAAVGSGVTSGAVSTVASTLLVPSDSEFADNGSGHGTPVQTVIDTVLGGEGEDGGGSGNGSDGVVIGLTVPVGDIPVAIEIGPEPGLTVGPIGIGSEPEPGDSTFTDVTEPITESVGTVVAVTGETPLAPATGTATPGLLGG